MQAGLPAAFPPLDLHAVAQQGAVLWLLLMVGQQRLPGPQKDAVVAILPGPALQLVGQLCEGPQLDLTAAGPALDSPQQSNLTGMVDNCGRQAQTSCRLMQREQQQHGLSRHSSMPSLMG